MPHAERETDQSVAHAIPSLRAGSFVHVGEPQEAHRLKAIDSDNSVGNPMDIMNLEKEPTTSKKRESRAGTRKVTSLSAEQLERKRANDREAQRTIRQRTREHIDQLQLQVAELKAKGDHFDDVVRRNAALEDELCRLRHQLAMATSGQSYSDHEPIYSGQSGPPLSSPFPAGVSARPSSAIPSTLPPSSQIPLAPAWQPYNSARSNPLYEPSDAGYANKVEPYVLQGQLPTHQMPPAAGPMSVAPNQIAYNFPGSSQPANPAAVQQFPPTYQPENPHPRHGEMLPQNTQPVLSYGQSQRSMSVPPFPSESLSDGYTVLQGTPQTQQTMNEPPRTQTYNYPWGSQS